MADLRTHVDTLRSLLETGDDEEGCGCNPSFTDETLVVDATACEDNGRLEVSPDCRRAVIDALTQRDVTTIRTETAGIERVYEDGAAALLVAAGRFVEAAQFHDERLAMRARRDPLGAAHEASGRIGAVADIAAETGLAELAARAVSYETALAPYVGPTVSRWRVDPTPPPDSTLVDVRELDTGGTVRRYERAAGVDRYSLHPVETQLDEPSLCVLASAYERLASGEFEGGDRAPARAVRAVVSDRLEGADTSSPATAEDSARRESIDTNSIQTEVVAQVLSKHARGHGLLEDLFADSNLSDAFVTAPAAANCLRVTVGGETLETNVRLTDRGVAALSSRFRRESGRAFSRADPTLDASATVGDRRIRVAGVTEPTSDGAAFAFRAQDPDSWTLPALIGNGTLSATAGALLSVAIERGSAALTAGPRGAGKTTLLGALMWELPPTVRTVVIEDTPELPVKSLQETGRDVQALLASSESEELSTGEALRTALRLGDGALVVGEVRGEEAAVLYEAMRVGANSEAVLGTIHGDGGASVAERVVNDLGVSPSSFGATDLVVTCEIASDNTRRVKLVEEVVDSTPAFETLFERTETGLEPTGRIDRGNSRLVAGLADPDESYADVRERLTDRERLLTALVKRDETGGDEVTDSHGQRR